MDTLHEVEERQFDVTVTMKRRINASTQEEADRLAEEWANVIVPDLAEHPGSEWDCEAYEVVRFEDRQFQEMADESDEDQFDKACVTVAAITKATTAARETDGTDEFAVLYDLNPNFLRDAAWLRDWLSDLLAE